MYQKVRSRNDVISNTTLGLTRREKKRNTRIREQLLVLYTANGITSAN